MFFLSICSNKWQETVSMLECSLKKRQWAQQHSQGSLLPIPAERERENLGTRLNWIIIFGI